MVRRALAECSRESNKRSGGRASSFCRLATESRSPRRRSGYLRFPETLRAYIQELLENTARSANPQTKLRQHFTEAVSIGFDGFSASVFLRNRERLEADKMVLATEHPESRKLLNGLTSCQVAAWHPSALCNLDPKQDVLLLGSGMTAVDTFLALVSQGHAGVIHMVSRHGKLLLLHEPYPRMPSLFHPEQISARGLLRQIRSEKRQNLQA